MLGCKSPEPTLSCVKKNKINNISEHFFALVLLFVSDDRHRVKLHPLLGDPNSDYINANYIDVSEITFFCLSSTWETNCQPLLRFYLSYPSKPQSIYFIPLSPPVGWPTFTWKLSSNQTPFFAVFCQMPWLSIAAPSP